MDKGSTARLTALSQCIAALANLDDEMDLDSVLAALIAFYRWRPDMEIGDLVWELQYAIETLKSTAAPELGVLLHMVEDVAAAERASADADRARADQGGDHEDRG